MNGSIIFGGAVKHPVPVDSQAQTKAAATTVSCVSIGVQCDLPTVMSKRARTRAARAQYNSCVHAYVSIHRVPPVKTDGIYM